MRGKYVKLDSQYRDNLCKSEEQWHAARWRSLSRD